jgi:hypothetical protein
VIIEREVHDGRFVVRSAHPRMKVSWAVVGLRRDPQARRNALRPVAPKSGRDRGRYLDPSLYGQPQSKGIIRRLQPTSTTAAKTRAAAPSRPRLASER